MTKQEIFNNVWNYFIVKKHPQATEAEYCRYRGPKSNCAVGCQLPDELYTLAMEELSVTSLFNVYPKVAEHFGSGNKRLLIALQSAHDTAFIDLENQLRRIAIEFDLTIP